MFKNKKNLQGGFSLIEISIVVFFTIILTSVTVYNYRNFDNMVELKNQALEIALTIREAQVNALSSRGTDVSDPGTFRYSYGVFFDKANHDSSYMFFVNKDDDDPATKFWFDDLSWDCAGNECIKKHDLRTGYTITDICIPEGTCGVETDVSISFKRPDPEAIIRDQNNSSTNLASVEIELSSPKGATSTIHVTQTGQIYIE
ncbi:MAG: hypothetical protein KAS07_03645 [Candidatus Pacebacteria bacterium]|nr:hypothetical protein [Candidatus Paceibacterota bacterium]